MNGGTYMDSGYELYTIGDILSFRGGESVIIFNNYTKSIMDRATVESAYMKDEDTFRVVCSGEHGQYAFAVPTSPEHWSEGFSREVSIGKPIYVKGILRRKFSVPLISRPDK